MSRHAETTRVPVAQTRGEIDKLLRTWSCDGVRWTDHWNEGKAVLEFLWKHADTSYMARFTLVAGDLDSTMGEQEWRRIHRVLRVFLLGQFNAVEAGLVSVEEVFLSHIVGPNDRTVAEQLLPKMPELIGQGASALLALPGGAS